MNEPLLEVSLSAGYGKRTIIQDLQFTLVAGERLGLVGTSGAGKSTLLLALLGLLPWRNGWTKGEVRLQGVNLLGLKEREARRLRGKAVALVPQSPTSALNSALSLQTHFQEAWRAHEPANRLRLGTRTEELLRRVNLPSDPAFLKRKPGEISVGQAQRCALALALLHRPALVIADEPTSALDPSTQVEVLKLLREITRDEDASILFVSHDLLSVLRLCTRIAVLHGGTIAECLATADIAQTQHPALRDLLRTLPAPPAVLLRYLAEESWAVTTPLLSEELLTLPC
ncbi:MAG: ATP-binding cassette domain-containing protein [Janthinobacterium lividum]